MISYIRTKKEGISQVSPSFGKSEKSLIYAKKADLLARKCAILRKSILLPKRFDHAELYQLSGHYTLARQGLEPFYLY